MIITLASSTIDGQIGYSVSVDGSPVSARTTDKETALRAVSHWALRATMRGRRPEFRRWDGDAGVETNLFPDLAPDGVRRALGAK